MFIFLCDGVGATLDQIPRRRPLTSLLRQDAGNELGEAPTPVQL